MAGHWHNIKRNHSCRTPTSLAFVAIQTSEEPDGSEEAEKHKVFRVGSVVSLRLERGMVTRREEVPFAETKAFWKHIYDHSSDRRPTWVYTYDALHTFTLLGLWAEIEEDRLWLRWKGDKGKDRGKCPSKGELGKPGFMCIEDTPFIVELKHDGGRIRFLDVRNYGDIRREEILDPVVCGSGSGDDSREHGLGSDPGPEPEARGIETHILKMMSWWRDMDGGVWKSTAAGLAWNNYRHKHMHLDICCHTDAEALRIEKEAYYGGIVEARYKGPVRAPWDRCLGQLADQGPNVTGPVYQVDVRSMYPSVMRGGLFPRRLVFSRRFVDWEGGVNDLSNVLRAYGACALVRIESPEYPYPVRIDGRTRHAYGRFWTTLCGPELRHALDSGHIVGVAQASVYSVGRLFDSYANHWLAERERYRASGEQSREAFCKLMGNSLYGRFAARSRRWRDRPDLMSDIEWGSWPERHLCIGHEMDRHKRCVKCGRDGGEETRYPVVSFRSIAGYVQELSKDELAGGAFPAIAAYVTSYARLLLRRVLAQCPVRSVLYVDTDGFLATQEAVDTLGITVHHTQAPPGEVRCVRAVADGEIVGCRAYRLGDDWLHAGLPAGVRRDPDGVWRYERQDSAAEILKTRPDGTVKTHETKFSFSHFHRNDEYYPDGWIKQLVLNEDEPPPF